MGKEARQKSKHHVELCLLMIWENNGNLQYETACEILRLLPGLQTVNIYLGLGRPRDWLKASLVYISNDPYSLEIEEEYEEQIKKIAGIFRGLKECLILRS